MRNTHRQNNVCLSIRQSLQNNSYSQCTTYAPEGRLHQVEYAEKCVNVNVAGRGLREYYDDNRASILQYGKDWYEMYGGREMKKAYYQQHREVFKARALARYYAKKQAKQGAASLNA